MLAAIRLKGRVEVPGDIKKTLDMLRLTRTNHCVLLPENPVYEGMLKKVKNYIAWGGIDPNLMEKLILKRGRKPGNKKLSREEAKGALEKMKTGEIKPVFRLSPPSKGFKSKRFAYPRGHLGFLDREINSVLRRMI